MPEQIVPTQESSQVEHQILSESTIPNQKADTPGLTDQVYSDSVVDPPLVPGLNAEVVTVHRSLMSRIRASLGI